MTEAECDRIARETMLLCAERIEAITLDGVEPLPVEPAFRQGWDAAMQVVIGTLRATAAP